MGRSFVEMVGGIGKDQKYESTDNIRRNGHKVCCRAAIAKALEQVRHEAHEYSQQAIDSIRSKKRIQGTAYLDN